MHWVYNIISRVVKLYRKYSKSYFFNMQTLDKNSRYYTRSTKCLWFRLINFQA